MNAASTLLPAPAVFCFGLPRNKERDPWFGMSRTFWASAIKANGHPPAVRSFLVKRPGQARGGVRRIVYADARAFIEKQSHEC